MFAVGEGAVCVRLVHQYLTDQNAPDATVRTVTASITFRTESEPHRWLNKVIAVHDGTIDFETMVTEFPTYICVPTAGASPRQQADTARRLT